MELKPPKTAVAPNASPALSQLGEYKGWKEIEITIDSGACDTVMPLSSCADVPVLDSERSRNHMEYEVANGQTIANEGERHCLMIKGAKWAKKVTFQVADVHKVLLSVSRVADAGYDCLLGQTGGQLVDNLTGDVSPIERKGNLYVMRGWVRADAQEASFGRQGPRNP